MQEPVVVGPRTWWLCLESERVLTGERSGGERRHCETEKEDCGLREMREWGFSSGCWKSKSFRTTKLVNSRSETKACRCFQISWITRSLILNLEWKKLGFNPNVTRVLGMLFLFCFWIKIGAIGLDALIQKSIPQNASLQKSSESDHTAYQNNLLITQICSIA